MTENLIPDSPAGSPPSAPYVGFARKWRPQNFMDLEGQDQVGKALRSEVEKGRIGHAYLFSGPRGVGKTSSARILAKAINCLEGPTPSPCGVCEHCRSIANGSNMDVIEIDGASNNSVDQVRDLRESVAHVPFSCRYKIYIIDEVHMLSIAAFNALLKTLEEPPAYVMFIFATTEPEKIPDTIKSRCQVFKFRAITLEDIVHRLEFILTQEKAEVEESERRAILETIALSAEGGMRDAQVALDQVISLSSGPLRLQDVRDFLGVADQSSLFILIENIRDRNTTALLEAVREMVERGRDLERFVKQTLAFLRDLLILRCGGSDDLVRLSAEAGRRARDLVDSLDTALLVNAVNMFLDLEARMKQGTNPRFMLEFTFVRLTALSDVTDIANLIQQIESGQGAGGSADSASASTRPASSTQPAQQPKRSVHFEAVDDIPEIGLSRMGAPSASAPPQVIPLAGGGALEPVDATDIGRLREVLMQFVREKNFALSRTLSNAPLDRIEGSVAWFGTPGKPIDTYDLQRLEKPETKKFLLQSLESMTGRRNLSLRFGVPGRMGAHASSAPEVVQAAAPEPVLEEPPQEIDQAPMMQVEEAETEAIESSDACEISVEAARRAFGKKGLSAARIRKMLEENETLRTKVDLVRKLFKGVILDGENRPVRI